MQVKMNGYFSEQDCQVCIFALLLTETEGFFVLSRILQSGALTGAATKKTT
jgi:hypothetical protein